jgi:hypothetical protein
MLDCARPTHMASRGGARALLRAACSLPGSAGMTSRVALAPRVPRCVAAPLQRVTPCGAWAPAAGFSGSALRGCAVPRVAAAAAAASAPDDAAPAGGDAWRALLAHLRAGGYFERASEGREREGDDDGGSAAAPHDHQTAAVAGLERNVSPSDLKHALLAYAREREAGLPSLPRDALATMAAAPLSPAVSLGVFGGRKTINSVKRLRDALGLPPGGEAPAACAAARRPSVAQGVATVPDAARLLLALAATPPGERAARTAAANAASRAIAEALIALPRDPPGAVPGVAVAMAAASRAARTEGAERERRPRGEFSSSAARGGPAREGRSGPPARAAWGEQRRDDDSQERPYRGSSERPPARAAWGGEREARPASAWGGGERTGRASASWGDRDGERPARADRPVRDDERDERPQRATGPQQSRASENAFVSKGAGPRRATPSAAIFAGGARPVRRERAPQQPLRRLDDSASVFAALPEDGQAAKQQQQAPASGRAAFAAPEAAPAPAPAPPRSKPAMSDGGDAAPKAEAPASPPRSRPAPPPADDAPSGGLWSGLPR